MQNLSCENDFFGLVLKQRLVASRKWPITSMESRISSVYAQWSSQGCVGMRSLYIDHYEHAHSRPQSSYLMCMTGDNKDTG